MLIHEECDEMAGVEQSKVEEGEAGMRLDRWFKTHFPGLGFGHLQKLLRSGQVRIDGGRAKSDTRIEAGQLIRIPPMGVDMKGAGGPLTGSPPAADMLWVVISASARCNGHGRWCTSVRRSPPSGPWA